MYFWGIILNKNRTLTMLSVFNSSFTCSDILICTFFNQYLYDCRIIWTYISEIDYRFCIHKQISVNYLHLMIFLKCLSSLVYVMNTSRHKCKDVYWINGKIHVCLCMRFWRVFHLSFLGFCLNCRDFVSCLRAFEVSSKKWFPHKNHVICKKLQINLIVCQSLAF